MTQYHSRIHKRENKRLRREQKRARRFLREVELKRKEMQARLSATGPESFAVTKVRRSWWRRLFGL